jgi:hypothetical protein
VGTIFVIGRLDGIWIAILFVEIPSMTWMVRSCVDFNLVQLFTANRFSVKEQKRYNGKYTHYTEIFPLETQTGKTNIFYIHS